MSLSQLFPNNDFKNLFLNGGSSDVSGDDHIAIGNSSGQVGQKDNAIAIGFNAGQSNQGSNALAIGNNAGRSNQNSHCVAIGTASGSNSQFEGAIAIGYNAGSADQYERAIAIGYNAGAVTQFQGAIAIGDQAGQSNQGTQAIAIGVGAGLSNQGANSIVIDAKSSFGDYINGAADKTYIRPLGTAVATTNPVYYNSTSFELYYVSSTLSTKNSIADLNVDTSSIFKIQPKTYVYNQDDKMGNQIGYIAEEVSLWDKNFATYETPAKDKPININWNVLTVYLIEEVKKLRREIDELKSR